MPNAKVMSEKQAIVAALTEKLQGSAAGVLVDYKGITVAEDTALRNECRKNNVEYAVVKNTMLRLNLRGNVRYYLIGWFGPMVLTILGAVLYYAIYPGEFTLATLKTTLATQPMSPAAIIAVMLFSPWLNLIPCLGEEWGWRGYLLPKVAARMKFLPTVLLTGFIWGIWHAPIIVTGHNYGVGYAGYPWAGIVAMCLFCIVSGTLLSYITLKTNSCWPAVLAHGAINGTAAVGTLFLANPMVYDRFIGPAPTGIIGGFAYLLVAIWIVWRMRKE